MKISTIFLDLDGTLLDTSERHYKLYKDILDLKELSSLKKKDYWKIKRSGNKTRETLPKSTPEKIVKEFENEWIENIEKKSYLKYDVLFPEIKNVLSILYNEFDLILVTLRNNTENLHWEISHLNLDRYFKTVIVGKGSKKKLIEDYILNHDNDNNYFIIGDTEEDVKAGLELKIPMISVTYGIRSRQFLKQLKPDYCIDNFNELLDVIEKLN